MSQVSQVSFMPCGEVGCPTLLPSDSDAPRMYGVPPLCTFHRVRHEMKLREDLRKAVTTVTESKPEGD